MRNWTKLLPFFLVVWIARRYGEKYTIWLRKEDFPRSVVSPFMGVYIYTAEEIKNKNNEY